MNNNINLTISNLLDKNSESESDIRRNVSKKYFYDLIEKEKINLDLVVNKKNTNNTHFHKFNCLVTQLCETKKVNMIDIAVFLYMDMFDELTILDCLNAYNENELREEFSKKYGIKLDKNILKDFLS